MDKIVGNIVLFLLVGFCCPIYTQIMLRSLDTKGAPLHEVARNVPFKLEVSLDGQSSMQRPLIKGLEQVHVYNQETKMQIINGRSSVKHTYTVRLDTAGTYTFGPAEITVHNKRLVSPTVTVTATNAPTTQTSSPATHKNDGEPVLFARLLVDKHHVVVGERVRCTLQIFTAEPNLSLQEIATPPLEEFSVLSRTGPIKSTKKQDGITYTCVEWEWALSAQKAQETLVIPAFRIDYLVPFEEEDDFGQLSSFFGPRLRRKRAYSNSVSLDVVALPAHKGVVHGIGAFKHFNAHVKPPVTQEGDGIVLTLEIEGEGDQRYDAPFALTNMPRALKWYDSKTYTTDATPGTQQKKCFEYIVQGIEPGTWEIPSQSFTYFDTAHHQYKTLTTEPLTVTITPHHQLPQQHVIEPESEVAPDSMSDLDNNIDIRPLHTDVWYVQRERAIPFWLFIIILVAPVMFLSLGSLRRTLAQHMIRKSGNKKRNQAFKHARKQLNLAENTGEYTKIYPIFIELLATRFGVTYAEVSEDSIEQLLKKNGLSDVRYGQWHSFFATIAGLVFAGQSKVSLNIKDIFAQSHDWLNVLEDVL